jgi:hypothetical protein
MIGDPPPVQQCHHAVLLQGDGISEVFILVEAGLRYMKEQCIKPDQMQRLRRHRDVLAQAHDDRMFLKEHELPVYAVVEAHSIRQDVADLMTVAEAAEELEYTVQHVRRLARAGVLQQGAFGLLVRSHVLTLKRQRKLGA